MIKNFFKNKKVLVTGATGFKGSWLCSWLNILGAKVYGTGFNPNYNKNLFKLLKLKSKININIFDIRNYHQLENLIKKYKPTIVFHLAAQPLIIDSYNNPKNTFEINILGTLNCLEIFKKYKFLRSLICITSDKCYENFGNLKNFKESDRLGGVDPYSASKASAELIINAYQKSFFLHDLRGVASARAGNVIGGGDWSANRLIPDSVKSILNNEVIYLRNPKFNRPWQFVLEPLRGYLMLAYNLYYKPGQFIGPWNFGTSSNSVTSVEQIVKWLINYWEEGKYESNKQTKYYEQHNLQLDSNKAKKILKWSPTYNIKKSVQITAEWYKEVYVNKKDPYEVTKKQILDYMNDNNWH